MLSISSPARARNCKPHVDAYASAHRLLRKCLSAPKTVTVCEGPMADVVDKVRSIHRCLPDIPPGQGAGGGYETKMSLNLSPKCQDEAEALKADALFKCIADWNFSARQRYKLDLPKDDCHALVVDFSVKKLAFDGCMKKHAPRMNRDLKVTY